MIIGGLVEVFLGVDAEGKSLEDVASAAVDGLAVGRHGQRFHVPAGPDDVTARVPGPAAAFLVVAGPRPSPGLDC